ncbi:hypothetical protein EI555_012662 [Monodon monoceros]|uniref:Uncharacterized protein n=1 Tax=Monodon monoceros TaxID=40151 RepID=A0A4U1EX04_MONMO|nr:hypothetical protein EI555_012662 [Monodon monoceros]
MSHEYAFFCHRWLDQGENDGKIVRELYARDNSIISAMGCGKLEVYERKYSSALCLYPDGTADAVGEKTGKYGLFDVIFNKGNVCIFQSHEMRHLSLALDNGSVTGMAEALPRRPREGAPVREAGAERRKPLSQRADREGQVCVSHKPAFNSELSPPPLLRVQLRGRTTSRGARGLSAQGGSADARVIYRDPVPPAGVQPAPHNTRSGPRPPGLSQARAVRALGQSGGSDRSS